MRLITLMSGSSHGNLCTVGPLNTIYLYSFSQSTFCLLFLRSLSQCWAWGSFSVWGFICGFGLVKRSFASGFCLICESELIESLAMMDSLRVEAHVDHSTGGSMPPSQKNETPAGERNSGTGADCAMLCPRNTEYDYR